MVSIFWRHRLPLAALPLLLAACATPLPPQRPLPLREAGELLPAAAGASFVAWPAERWWQRYGDAQLDALINRALVDAPGMQMAAARLAQAEALVAAADAGRQPRLDAGLDLSRQRFSANSYIPPPFAGAVYNTGQFAFNFSYEFDFWGKQRAALAAALSQAQAQSAELAAARVVLATALAHSYNQFDLLSRLHDIADDSLAQRQQTLALTRQRVAAGLEPRTAAVNDEAAVHQAEQEVAALTEQLALTRHLLAALSGQGPAAGEALQRPQLAALAGTAPTQLPADLLGRRADVAASRWRVEAAQGQVAVARARYYPNVNLTAFAGFSSIGLDELFKGSSHIAGIEPAISLPLFDAGRLRANEAAQRADLDGAIAAYNQSLLTAVREVADSVAAAQAVGRQLTSARQSLALADEARRLAQTRAEAGLASRSAALAAKVPWLESRRNEAQVAARARAVDIDLNKALGGGYQAATLPIDVSGANSSTDANHANDSRSKRS